MHTKHASGDWRRVQRMFGSVSLRRLGVTVLAPTLFEDAACNGGPSLVGIVDTAAAIGACVMDFDVTLGLP